MCSNCEATVCIPELKVTVKTDAPNLGKSTYCVQLAELQVIPMIGRVALGSTYLRPFKIWIDFYATTF